MRGKPVPSSLRGRIKGLRLGKKDVKISVVVEDLSDQMSKYNFKATGTVRMLVMFSQEN